jgi:hypothetical protein
MSDGTTTEGQAASRAWPWVVIGAHIVLVGALIAWLASGRPIGIPGAWAWEVRPKALRPDALVRVVLLGLGVIGLCAWGAARIRARRRSDGPVVAGLVCFTFLLQLSVASLAPASAFMMVAGTASPVSTEYFDTAWTLSDPGAFCRDYASTMLKGRHHVATHPPGAVLTFWALLKVYRSPSFPGGAFSKLAEFAIGARRREISEAVGAYPRTRLAPEAVGPALFCCVAFGLLGALTLVPLYHLTRQVASRRAAVMVCSLFALTPAQLLFFQGLDSLLLLLVVLALAWTVIALGSGRWRLAVAAGAALGVAFLISFGALAAIGVALLLGAAWALRSGTSKRAAAWRTVALVAAGFAAVAGAGDVACDMKLPLIFRQAMAAHRQFTWVEQHRTYGTWVGLNLVEFFCFLGLPVLVTAFGAAWTAGRRGWSRADLVGVSGAAVLLLLDASGSVRGEVGRIWLFLMPALVLWGGCWLARGATRGGGLALWTAVLTLLEVIALGIALTPVVMPF